MAAEVKVRAEKQPDCDFCSLNGRKKPAWYDFKTKHGPWANGCEAHYQQHRMFPTLGTGKGQQFIID